MHEPLVRTGIRQTGRGSHCVMPMQRTGRDLHILDQLPDWFVVPTMITEVTFADDRRSLTFQYQGMATCSVNANLALARSYTFADRSASSAMLIACILLLSMFTSRLQEVLSNGESALHAGNLDRLIVATAKVVLMPMFVTVTMVGFMGTLARAFLGPSLHSGWACLNSGWASLHLALFSAVRAIYHVSAPTLSDAPGILRSVVGTFSAAALQLAAGSLRRAVGAVKKLAMQVRAWFNSCGARWEEAQLAQQVLRRQQQRNRDAQRSTANLGVREASGAVSAKPDAKAAAQPSSAKTKSGASKRARKAARSAARDSPSASTPLMSASVPEDADAHSLGSAASAEYTAAVSKTSASTSTTANDAPSPSGAPTPTPSEAPTPTAISNESVRGSKAHRASVLDSVRVAMPRKRPHSPSPPAASIGAATESSPAKLDPKQKSGGTPRTRSATGASSSLDAGEVRQQEDWRTAEGPVERRSSPHEVPSTPATSTSPGSHGDERLKQDLPSAGLSHLSLPPEPSEEAAGAATERAGDVFESAPAGQQRRASRVFSGEFRILCIGLLSHCIAVSQF